MEALFVTLIGSAIAGITFIAYRHPDGYQKLHGALTQVCTAVILLIVIFYFAQIWAASGILTEQLMKDPQQKIEYLEYSIKSVNSAVNWIVSSLLIGGASLSYLYFLRQLPKILNIDRSSPEADEE
jgi:TRAP-type C4-dicarboxylate transport system permease small subunit